MRSHLQSRLEHLSTLWDCSFWYSFRWEANFNSAMYANNLKIILAVPTTTNTTKQRIPATFLGTRTSIFLSSFVSLSHLLVQQRQSTHIPWSLFLSSYYQSFWPWLHDRYRYQNFRKFSLYCSWQSVTLNVGTIGC